MDMNQEYLRPVSEHIRLARYDREIQNLKSYFPAIPSLVHLQTSQDITICQQLVQTSAKTRTVKNEKGFFHNYLISISIYVDFNKGDENLMTALPVQSPAAIYASNLP